MLGAGLDTGGPVGVLALGVHLPRVGYRVVALHGRAFLLADAIVEEVAARETVALLRSGAATGAKEMAALARLGSETAPLVALGTAVDFGELLAVFGALAPTAGRAGLVALGAFAFRLGEVVDVDVLGTGAGDDLLPVDGLHVAQVVVVEQTATARQNISEGGHLQRVHLGEGNDERELFVVDAEFEERPPADDLQRRKDDAADVHVADEDVAGHLADVLQEGQVEVLVLQPRQLQVTVDVGAVGVAVAQVAVVVFPVRWYRHPTVGTDANFSCSEHFIGFVVALRCVGAADCVQQQEPNESDHQIRHFVFLVEFWLN